MKTKRLAWVVAGVVVLLTITVLVPFADDVYVWLAYEEAHTLNEAGLEGTDVLVFTPLPGKKLRWNWLPGPLYVFDDVCYRCIHNRHGQCDGEDSVVWIGESGAEAYHYQQYTCTCPDPSHKDKP